MYIFRNILAVIIGYSIFVASALVLFRVGDIRPHADPTIGILILTIGWGLVFSFAGGYLAQVIAKGSTLTINYVLAAIIAGFAAFSLFKSTGNHYSQIAAIFLFAPASIAGGMLRLRRRK